MKAEDINNIDKSRFEFADREGKVYDEKFTTKPVGYYKDAFKRFVKSRVSVAAAIILFLMIIFCIFIPWINPYNLEFRDPNYGYMLPKNRFLSNFGIATGMLDRNMNSTEYDKVIGINLGIIDYEGTGTRTLIESFSHHSVPLKKEAKTYTRTENATTDTFYSASIDVYYYVGFIYQEMSTQDLEDLKSYEQETGKQVIYPMVYKYRKLPNGQQVPEKFRGNANYWYVIDEYGRAVKNPDGSFQENYLRDSEGTIKYYQEVNLTSYEVRVLSNEYFEYKNGRQPQFFFGTNGSGQDLLIRLAKGLQVSFALGFSVAILCFLIGTIIGAFEGYFGGWVDIIIERIIEIIAGVPFIVMAILFQLHLVVPGHVGAFGALLFTFIVFGWMGTAHLVRTQFYRFKSQEYVLAARTLGAGNRRIMFKHIFPNTLGTIITAQALAIPGVIYTETALAYLNIIKLSQTSSIGYMLSDGQGAIASWPHIIMFPIITLLLLMIAFNLLGNGLRDAFNPALRGT